MTPTFNLDKSRWRTVAFGDAVRNVTERVDDPSSAGVDRYVGLEHLDPGVLTVQRWDSPERVAAQKLRFYRGDVIFGRRRAYQKKVAMAEFEGICSAHALVLRAKQEYIHPDFLPVFLASDVFLDRAVAISVGSLSPTVNWGDLKVQQFRLPPLDEQERIADLMWALERHREAVAQARRSALETRRRFVEAALSGLPERRSLGDLVKTRSGPSFPATAVSSDPVDGAIAVLGITNTLPDGKIDLGEVGYVTGLPESTGTIDESSLVLIRTNGNRQRIGNVYIPPVEAHGMAVSAFQFLMKAHDAADREFIFWVLQDAAMQARMSEAASGTTGLSNLAVRWLSEQCIPWDHEDSRSEVVKNARTIEAGVKAIDDEVAALTRLRSALLAALFGVPHDV